MTSNLKPKAYEGWTGHIIAGDEPFEKFIYDASVRGLSETDGVFLLRLHQLILIMIGYYDVIESPNKKCKNVGCVRGTCLR